MHSLRVIFQLTSRCQLSCRHCIRADTGPRVDLPVDIIKKVLPQAMSYGIRRVAFTGGEPTLHPQFIDIVDLVCTNGFTFGFITNGWNFAETYKELLPYRDYLEVVGFSLDGAREETHDRLRMPGSYRRVMQAVSICQARKIPFTLQMTVTAESLSELEDMAILASRLGSQGLRYLHLQPTPQVLTQKLDITPEQCRCAESEVGRLGKLYRLPIAVSLGAYHPSPWFQCDALQMREFTIDHYGNLAFCCLLAGYSGGEEGTEVLGNLDEVDFYEAHRRLIERISELQREKVQRIANGNFDMRDHFPCWFCAKYFHKVDWMKDFPESRWLQPEVPERHAIPVR